MQGVVFEVVCVDNGKRGRKGAFFWHPAYLVMIIALVAQLAARRLESLIMILIVALNLYIGASWSDYSFGDSFGCRQIVEMTPLLVLPMAAAIERVPAGNWRRVAAGLGAVLIAINLVQFHGYMVGALPHNRTTIDRYVAFWGDRVGLHRGRRR